MTVLPMMLAVAFYGVKFDPAMTNAPTASCFYPIRQGVCRMIQPDGRARTFLVTDREQGMMIGDRPWVGVQKDGQVDVWADPEHTGGKLRTAFSFVRGILRRAALDGVKHDFVKGPVRGEGLEKIFPKREKRSYERNSRADLWRGKGTRLRLWFANPNAAGALLAELALLALYGCVKFRGAGRLAAGACALLFSCGMFATGSRSALVGFSLGLLCLAAGYYRRLCGKRGLAAIGLAIAVFALGIALSGNAGRIGNTFRHVDRGNALRIKVTKAALQMFADAPRGWSGGEVPGRNACLNWYVPDESHSLRTHMMSLAELGWFKGYAYVLFWMTILIAALRAAFRGNPAMAMVWTAFGAAGLFNPVYINWEVWVVPLLSLLGFADPQSRPSGRGVWVLGACSLAVSLIVVAGLVTAGGLVRRSVKTPVKSVGKATYVNGADPRIWIVGDELVLGGGGFPGRDILRYYAKNPKAGALAYVYDVADLPETAETVVLAGRAAADYLSEYGAKRAVCRAKRLILLSPAVGPGAIPAELRKDSKVVVIAGNLLALHDASFGVARPWVAIVPGCKYYIPQWMEMLMPRSDYRNF